MKNLDNTIVVGLIWNKSGKLLLCKSNKGIGVFPEEWGFPATAVKQGEKIIDALEREIRDELGIEVENIENVLFKDREYDKTLENGLTKTIYTIFLVFACTALSDDIKLKSDYLEYTWATKSEIKATKLNVEALDTLEKINF